MFIMTVYYVDSRKNSIQFLSAANFGLDLNVFVLA